MVKELFYHNKYYFFEGNSLTIHNEYPPFLSLIEYLWCMLSGGYKEKFLYNGKILVSISFLFPFVCSKSSFHKISKEKFFSSTINILIAAVFIILLPVYFSTFFYSTIYAEGSLVTAFVICIYAIINDNDGIFYTFYKVSCLFALLLIKQISIFFVVVLFMYQLFSTYSDWIKQRYRINFKYLLKQYLPFIISLFIWKLWNMIAGIYAEAGQFDSGKFSIQNFVQLYLGSAPAYRYTTLNNYLNALISWKIKGSPLHISYMGYLFIYGIAIFMIIYFGYIRKKIISKHELYVLIFAWATAIIYIAVMLISYLFGFSETESVSLASYDRYMGTMLSALMVMLLIIVWRRLYRSTNSLNVRNIKGSVYISVLILMGMASGSLTKELMPGFLNSGAGDIFSGDALIINGNTEADSDIYLICQEDNGSGVNIIAYKCFPRRFNTIGYSLGKDDGGSYNLALSSDELLDRIKEYEYLYLSNIDDYFRAQYNFLPAEPENQMLYRVEAKGNKLRFELLYNRN